MAGVHAAGMPGVSLRLLEEKAKRLGHAGEWGALALGVNSRILEIDPENVGALTRRARCNVALDDYPAAKADFERALALGPRSRTHREDLARGLAEVEEGFEEAKGRRRKRKAAAKRREVEAERVRAEAREREEKRERLLAEVRAIETFEDARALGVLYAGGYPGGGPPGRTHAVSIDLELAEVALRRAFEIDPRKKEPAGRRDPGVYEVPTRLAGVFRAQGDLTRAAATYEWVLEREDSPYAKVGLAAVRQDQGRPHEALELYEEVLRKNPGDAYGWRGMARTLTSLGRVEDKVRFYESAAEISGDEAQRSRAGLRRLLAEFRRNGRTEEAEAVARALGRMGG
jgi:tetratricopeptide (TPR) repeat protein